MDTYASWSIFRYSSMRRTNRFLHARNPASGYRVARKQVRLRTQKAAALSKVLQALYIALIEHRQSDSDPQPDTDAEPDDSE